MYKNKDISIYSCITINVCLPIHRTIIYDKNYFLFILKNLKNVKFNNSKIYTIHEFYTSI